MNKYWESKYFENNTKESQINIFKSLEIENYLKQLLKKKNFNLHTYRLNFSNSTLQVFLSVYKKTITNEKNRKFATKKTELLNKIESKSILKTLNSFTKNKYHLTLKILNLSKHTKENEVKTNLNLSRFKIPELEQLYPLILSQRNSAKLLGIFIAEYLKKTKRHNPFFNSLEKSLNLILKQKNSKIKGIKILVKGRLSNAARSKNRYIKIGMTPLLTKSRLFDYSETIAYTSNGTIGIKIWISYKKLQNIKKVKDKNTTINLKNF